MADDPTATAATCSHGPGCPLPWSLHDWSYEADYATAASIPYEGTDCTADEAVEAVKAVRTTAAPPTLCEKHTQCIAGDGHDGPCLVPAWAEVWQRD